MIRASEGGETREGIQTYSPTSMPHISTSVQPMEVTVEEKRPVLVNNNISSADVGMENIRLLQSFFQT